MPELFVTSGPDLGKTYRVQAGATLGRLPDCDVRLADKSISRRHAHLERDGDRWVLVDDGSRNGIFQDEERVERIELADGAEFKVGELYLRFRSMAVEAAAPAPPPPVDDDFEEEISLDDDETAPEIVVGGGAGAAAPRKLERPAPARPKPAAPARATSAARERQAAELAATAARKRSDEGVQARGATGRVLLYSRIENRSGFFSADLSQYPWWIKLPVLVLVLAVAFGGAWVAFQGADVLFGTPDEVVEER